MIGPGDYVQAKSPRGLDRRIPSNWVPQGIMLSSFLQLFEIDRLMCEVIYFYKEKPGRETGP